MTRGYILGEGLTKSANKWHLPHTLNVPEF